MEVVLWFTVLHIQVQVARPVDHNADGPSLSAHQEHYQNTPKCPPVAEHQRPGEEGPYHSGYRFKVEARQFDDVSKFKYGTERRGLWMVKASADVASINPLHQITPRNTVDR